MEGYRKFIVAIIGLIAQVAVSYFGWTPEKADTITQSLTALAPLIATVLYYVANLASTIAHSTATAPARSNGVQALQPDTTTPADTAQPLGSAQDYVQPAPSKVPVPEVPFDKDKLMALATAQAAKLEASQTPSTERVFYSAIGYAQDVVAFAASSLNRVRDCYSFLLQLGKQAYFEQAQHPYGEGQKHLADYNPKCPYSTVQQMARAEGFEDTMSELNRLEGNLNFIEWAQAKGIDLIEKAPTTLKSLYLIGELARELYRQSQ